MAVSAKCVGLGNHAEKRLLLQSCEAQRSEHWRWDEQKGKHLKIVKLTRKKVVEHKRKQKEILRFLALVYGS